MAKTNFLLCGDSCMSSYESREHQSDPTPIIIITHNPMSEATLRYTLGQVHEALNTLDTKIPYAIVGGGALWALGSIRQTADIDILVQDEDKQEARKMLLDVTDVFGVTDANNLFFRASGGNRRCYNIDIITPAKVALSRFPDEIARQHATLARIASIPCQVEMKIQALRDVERRTKKLQIDSGDLEFLGRCASERGLQLGFGTIPCLNKEFVDSFRRLRPSSEELSKSVGCELEE